MSDSGTLVFATESLGIDGLSMTGLPPGAVPQTLPVRARLYADPVVSPNGRFVAVEDVDESDDIWVVDVRTGVPQRLTFDDDEDETPVWSPDSVWVAYASNRGGTRHILRRRADGGGAEETLWSGALHVHVEDWTSDGRYLITSGVEQGNVSLLDLHASPRVMQPLGMAQRRTLMARLSADRRWLAYVAGEPGSEEIYVQDFPQLTARWQVTQGGGLNPMWAPDGRWLFYRRGATLLRVPVETSAGALTFGTATPVFSRLPGVKGNHRSWAVMPNGDALVLEIKASDQGAFLNVVLNWTSRLTAH